MECKEKFGKIKALEFKDKSDHFRHVLNYKYNVDSPNKTNIGNTQSEVNDIRSMSQNTATQTF